ncbi:MAG: hypothetical protein AAF702_10790 [Chloroflexota bacterium]
MASAIYTTASYKPTPVCQQATAEVHASKNNAEVTFVPTVVDLETPARRVARSLQLRRQVVNLFSGFVSGAVSLR